MELQDSQGMYIKLNHSTFQFFPSIATSPYPLTNFVDKLIQMGTKNNNYGIVLNPSPTHKPSRCAMQ
jgi:hypothetical protein